jgi:hypothetical protein
MSSRLSPNALHNTVYSINFNSGARRFDGSFNNRVVETGRRSGLRACKETTLCR